MRYYVVVGLWVILSGMAAIAASSSKGASNWNTAKQDALIQDGIRLVKEADYARAIEVLGTSLVNANFNAAALKARAHAHMMLRNFDEAEVDLNAIIRNLPNDAWAYQARAVALEERGQPRRAALDYAKAVTMNAQEPQLWLGLQRTVATWWKVDAGAKEMNAHVRALSSGAKNQLSPRYLRTLAWVSNRNADYRAAARYARWALSMESGSFLAHRELGFALLKLGEIDDARKELNIASMLRRADPFAHDWSRRANTMSAEDVAKIPLQSAWISD